jgi:hypothetical protein
MLKQDIPRTVRFEAAATVRKAMQFVTSSTVSKVKEQALKKGVSRFSADGRIGGSTSVSKRSSKFGQQWLVRYDIAAALPMSIWSGTLNPLADHTGQGWRVSDADWNRYKFGWARDMKDTALDIKARVGARGLTAKSWYEIIKAIGAGDSVGNVPAFVQRARPISGRSRGVGFAVSTGDNTSQFQLTVINTSGIAVKTGGERKLASAITIRRKFFLDSLKKNFFFDARFVAKNYKWAKVS